jgi:hypothetical protein
MLLGAEHFSRRHFEAGTPFADIKLRDSVSIPGGKRTVVPESSVPSKPGIHITY